MKIVIDSKKSVSENATYYYDRSKKAKKKIIGAQEALNKSLAKLEKLKAREIEVLKVKAKKLARKKEWYEKFRWFFSSEGFLCVGGRDATTNDILIRKHLEKDDFVFHTELAGSPFVIVKNPNNLKINDITKEEAALFCAVNSKQWGKGVSLVDVYGFGPSQVKKELGLPKGTFMIHGKREYFKPKMEVYIGKMSDGKVMSGAHSAVLKNCSSFVKIVPGDEKKSEIAKKIRHLFSNEVELDEVMQALPPGDCEIKKEK